MSTTASAPHHGTPPHDASAPGRRWGARAIALALVGATGLGWTATYSLTDVDPVPGLRIPLILLMPAGLVGAVLAAAYAWSIGGTARRRAAAALVIAGLVVAGFVALLMTAPGA